MAYTYSKLASTTVGAGGASTITFNNIPQNYTDLVLKISARGDTGGTRDLALSFNGSSSNFTFKCLYGNGAAAASVGGSGNIANEMPGATPTASTFGNGEIYIPNYTSANYKSIFTDSVTENNGTTATAFLTSVLWSNVTAISSIKLTPDTGSFIQYSTATLYGIRVEL